jgi:hypothetical protein
MHMPAIKYGNEQTVHTCAITNVLLGLLCLSAPLKQVGGLQFQNRAWLGGEVGCVCIGARGSTTAAHTVAFSKTAMVDSHASGFLSTEQWIACKHSEALQNVNLGEKRMCYLHLQA